MERGENVPNDSTDLLADAVDRCLIGVHVIDEHSSICELHEIVGHVGTVRLDWRRFCVDGSVGEQVRELRTGLRESSLLATTQTKHCGFLGQMFECGRIGRQIDSAAEQQAHIEVIDKSGGIEVATSVTVVQLPNHIHLKMIGLMLLLKYS